MNAYNVIRTFMFFFFNDTATTEIYTLSLHDALPISTTDAGAFQLHVRAPVGTRVEQTELIVAGVERAIRRVIPPAELSLVLSNVGINRNAINLATSASATLNAADADVLVQLGSNRSGSTWDYVRRLRATLPNEFPGVTFFAVPADIVNQVLNLGLPAPLDVQVVGANKMADYQTATRLAEQIRRIPGAVDVRVQQVANYPRSEEHTSELQSPCNLVCRLLL